MAQAPTSATIFSYRVGFGDCFLLRFDYPDRPRHLLIDFGTTGQPEDSERDLMVRVAKDIEQKCSGRLEAVVATHRHADHISGFTTKANGSGPGDVIAQMDIELVLQPWTEAPDAAVDAMAPAVDAPGRTMAARQAALQSMNDTAAKVVDMLDAKSLDARGPVRDQLEFIGRDNIKNLSAVENLMRIGRRHVYAYHGSDAGLGELLPGVVTHVLGPPTLEQTDTIRKQRSRDPDEYWHFALKGLEADDGFSQTDEDNRLFPNHPIRSGGKLPVEVRWIAGRLNEVRSAQFLSIVRALDKQMNNTSLILLFEAGGKKLLFPGDAQIENWRYALSKDEVLDLLEDVDLYKVGHHGSLNATPKSMWNQFKKRGKADRGDRLKTMLSTLPGKHGHDEDKTEVPRRSLLAELERDSELHSTHLMPADELCQEVTIQLGAESEARA
jgi:hypothetical protein